MRIATQKGISVFCVIASLSFVSYAITVSPGGVVDIDIDALAVNATSDTEIWSIRIPMLARQLHGMRVRIHGAMYPTINETGLTEFFLIPETNQRPVHWASSEIPLHAAIPIKLALGQTEDYQEQPITVEGVFEVHMQNEEQKPLGIYRLTAAKVVAKKIRLRGTPAIRWPRSLKWLYKSGKGLHHGWPSPHHLTSGSASGGSSKQSEVAPELFERK